MRLTLGSTLLVFSVCSYTTFGMPAQIQKNSRSQTSYLQYYGGAKGQYLEVKKDEEGRVISEKIVPENSVVDELSVPEEENTFSKVFLASLNSIQESARKLTMLQEQAKKTGHLTEADRKKYNTQLSLLGEAASNLANLSEESGQDLAAIFGNQKYDEENVGEASGEYEQPLNDAEQVDAAATSVQATLAEANPVAVAVAGEGGTAASAPHATALAGPGGVAVARPVATAVAGFDPAAVGFQLKKEHQ